MTATKGDDWRASLITSAAGVPKPLLANAITALRDQGEWWHVISFDVFAGQTMMACAPPWDASQFEPHILRPWTPQDDLLTTDWLQRHGIGVNAAVAAQAVEIVARDVSYHPVLEYLDGLEHDGMPRLDDWLTTYLGAEPTAYNQNIGRAMLIAAVARIRNPGCKVDTVPIFEGFQGALKSTAVKIMYYPWFTDELADLGSKDAAMQTRGMWGVEISELDSMSRLEVSKIKAFISRTTDRFRPPYGNRIIESPRACVFWGTTNSDDYLKDETGGRRFWPIKVGKIDIDGLSKIRDQLWAEADRLYAAGAAWWIVNPNIQRMAEQEQRDRYIGDPWDDTIKNYVERGDGDVSMDDVLRFAIGLDISRCGQVEKNRAARVLKSAGLVGRQRGTGANKRWVYSKPGASDMPVRRDVRGTSGTVVPMPGLVPQETPAAQREAPKHQKAPLF